MRSLLFAVSGAAILGLCSTSAFAFKPYLDNFRSHYEENAVEVSNLVSEASCGLCHNSIRGGGSRTPYGEDFKDVVLGDRQGFPGIEFFDSDSDGFINLEEIYLQTSPGSVDSAPAARIEADANGTTLNLTFADNCSELQIRAFGTQVITDGGASDNLKLNPNGTQAVLDLTDSTGVVLVSCPAQGFVGSYSF